MSESVTIFKDLERLVKISAAKYNTEFICQDIRLSDEFRFAFTSCLTKGGGIINYLDYTAVVTTSKNRQIYVPNQWFVIASYAVELCLELKRYQSFFFKVSDALSKDYEDFAKMLRGYNEESELKEQFITTAKNIISDDFDCNESEAIPSAYQLWRFCTDYLWWGGQKTIDRGDFMNSTILSLLNLVAASQGFVADIVYYYINDSVLCELVNNPADFTIGLELNQQQNSDDFVSSYNITNNEACRTLNDFDQINGNNESVDTPIITHDSSVHKIKISYTSLGKFNKK